MGCPFLLIKKETKMKILALHLPQYYTFSENDEWWGKGFTDWVNVKKAKPLFKNHQQPVVPLNKNYYDMTDVNTLKAQADIAKKYGVYGFCYYHYWFNGKLLLEKPVENLLNHPEVDNHYCLCWANESWARTWDGKENDILIKQTFGGETDWKAHIEYLLPFFKDDRYIKRDNKPMMYFYSCERIEKFNEMIDYWNNYLQQEGFKGLYVVEFVNSFNTGKRGIHSDAVTEFQPHCTARYAISNLMKAKRIISKKTGKLDVLSYEYIWKKQLSYKETYNGKKIIKGAFVAFDNTPRKGQRGMLIMGTPEKFGKYLDKLVKLNNRNYDKEFLVINAWNEWAEGAMLEPTVQNGYGYLEQIRKIIDKKG